MLAPPVWQFAQTAAFPVLVVVWVLVDVGEVIHGVGGWGAFTPWQVKQDVFTVPPAKSDPWQDWHVLNPLACDFADAPCWSGLAQPAG